MRTRTRVLITHYVRLCATGASQLIFIKGGVIQLSGDPAHLRQTGELNQVFEEEEKDHKDEALEETSTAATETVEEIVDDEVDETIDLNKKKPKTLVEEETRATGMVKFRLYGLYFKSAGSIFYWFCVFFAFIFLRSLGIAEAWWVKEWTQSYAAEDIPDGNVSDAASALNISPFGFHDFSNSARAFTYTSQDMAYNAFSRLAQPQHSLDYYLGIYILITSLQIVFSGLRFGLVYWGSLRASKILYVELLRRVFRAPLRFFGKMAFDIHFLRRLHFSYQFIQTLLPLEESLTVSQRTLKPLTHLSLTTLLGSCSKV
jgi:hypothetical protein